VTHSRPVGQALFVPREEIMLRDCSEEEIAAPYGLTRSPHYAKAAAARNAWPAINPSPSAQTEAARPDPSKSLRELMGRIETEAALRFEARLA
jgi:hypothetical protein